MTMKAMVLEQFGKPLSLKEVPRPGVGPEDVLIKVRACGICGSDLKITSGKIDTVPLPHIPGHEIAGEIVAAGDRVDHARIGETVSVHIYNSCGICRWCRSGRFNLCTRLNGRIGFELSGGLADYTVAPARNAIRVSDALSIEAAAVVPCGLLAIYHAVNRACIRPTDRIVMLGVGGLGIHGLDFVRMTGASVAAVDVKAEKLSAARENGADRTLFYDAFAKTKDTYDVIFDSVGNPQVTADCLRKLDKDGRYVMVAYSPKVASLFDSEYMHLNETQIIGTRNGSIHELKEIVALLEQRKMTAHVSRTLPLDQANQAIALVRDGDLTGKVVVRLS